MQSVQESGVVEGRESGVVEETVRQGRQLPFFKCGVVSFVRVGACHMCRQKGRVVYQCHRNYMSTSCQKKFCLDCLLLIYKDNIVDHLQKHSSWRCPYIRKVCRCKNCCLARKEPYSLLEMDPNLSVYSNLRAKGRHAEDEEEADDESMRCLLREKFKRLGDFNGQLINKVNSNYHKLTEDQIKFYNQLIHSNLNLINNLTKAVITHQALLDD